MRAIKKIAALAAGATLLGATLMGAMAGDLANYPKMCISGTTGICYTVVGDLAAAEDVVGSIDIGTKSLSTVETEELAEGEVSIEGDAVQIVESTDFLEYEEQVVGVMDVLTDDELEALGGGEISNDKGSFDYDEYLYTPAVASVQHTVDPDDDEDNVLNYLVFDEMKPLKCLANTMTLLKL